ncbi:MAG: hypothetical protein II567_17035 [Candidatus Riflebacteria bacterium]|nr:hypothetical protein [Candidatus Riflebacteria bacterium]
MKNNNKNRFGGSKVTIVVIALLVLIIAGASLGYTYLTGKELQEKQTKYWNQAFTLFSQKQPEYAYLQLINARSTFSESLDFYRKIATGTFLTKAEVNEAIVLICQSEAYDNLFNLESAESWIQKAKMEIENVDDGETRLELANYISRAEAADKFCAAYREYIATENLPDEKYQELVKNSLRVGTEAIKANDYDYTIFEIRFLIACGKAFEEPVLVGEARQQLFDITQSKGEDEKTKLLWSLLRN